MANTTESAEARLCGRSARSTRVGSPGWQLAPCWQSAGISIRARRRYDSSAITALNARTGVCSLGWVVEVDVTATSLVVAVVSSELVAEVLTVVKGVAWGAGSPSLVHAPRTRTSNSEAIDPEPVNARTRDCSNIRSVSHNMMDSWVGVVGLG